LIRFGLQIPSFTFDVPDSALFDRVAEIALAAEDSGFESVWVMDHLYQLPMIGGPTHPMLEGYSLLAALAARTSSVQLGTLVTGVTYRNPALLGKIVTTLDVISSGRAVCGIGAAWHDVEHRAFGFDFPAVPERMERLEEALQILRAMFDHEVSSFAGAHYRTEELRNLPRPVRRIPIMVGGGGEKKTLRLVAKYADMSNFFGDAEAMKHKIEVLCAHCADVGRDPGAITISRLGTLPDDEREAASQAAALADAGARYLIYNIRDVSPEKVARTAKILSSLN
jgi:F420-dependent oxidoreductase-like protein